MKCNTLACEEVQKFPCQQIESVKSLDRHILQSNREKDKTFKVHFHDSCACCPNLLVQEFRSYLADFPCLWKAEAASCEGVVTECNVSDVLKQVGLNK